MKNILIVAMVVLLGGVALAAAPHFVGTPTASIDGDGDLAVKFKIAGLGDAQQTLVSISADATAVFGCRTKSGNFPSAANKEETAGPVGSSGLFTSAKNGSVTGMLTASPPAAAAALVCPHGQTRVLCAATYTGVEISSDVAGTVDLGSLSVTPFPACL